ncbi:5-hydroxyisourate hydrolase, partial [Tremellales sp. Uapishka_1]
MSKSPITCHILDASLGTPAPNVKVSLQVLSLSEAEPAESDVTALEVPQILATGLTDADGRCTTLLDPETKLCPGVYKMTFFTETYFAVQKKTTFYPLVEITFNYTDPTSHHHIPLLISPFSYTTYRGS